MTSARPMRLRRCQLAVPGSSEKMLTKAAASSADHIFCDLEDAVAPAAKVPARQTIVKALTTLDWTGKTRCVRINDVRTEWCYEDIIEVVGGARENLDTIMVPKVLRASDIVFIDLLLGQLEMKLKLQKTIGIEVLIEETEALQNVDTIALASPRIESLIFGMGDYSASQQIAMREIGRSDGYPGDIFHYPRFRIAAAARAAGVDPIDGPYANFKDEEGLTRECKRALALGFAGKWAIHPAQIETALTIFSPRPEDVARAREMTASFERAVADGVGSVNVRGVMVDIATVRLLSNTIKRAEMIGM